MSRWGPPLLGIVAVLALLGLTRSLPPQVAFFLSALAVILFPGMAISSIIAGCALRRDALPERLAVWFVVGIGTLSALGLLGLILRVHLRHVVVLCIFTCSVLTAVLAVRAVASRRRPGGEETVRSRLAASPLCIILLAAAIALALITLVTPRDYDDWYYMAYIKDYTAGARLASEDGIFGMGNPATPRIWFGGGWWVLEAMLARTSGVDTIACHQVYMPILVLPFAVLGAFALAGALFRSAPAALAACGFQGLFYLSGAYPYKSAGWMVFARMAQDKAVACFVVVPVAAAVALRLFRRGKEADSAGHRGLVYIYWSVVLTSVLIHGMGPIWLSLFIVPFALVEWLRDRTRVSAVTSARAVLPILACGFVLLFMSDLVKEVVVAPPQEVVRASVGMSDIYLPGMPFSLGTDTTNPVTLVASESFQIINPLFVARYPLAIAGLALTFALFAYASRSMAARFLLSVTLTTLVFLFTPIGVALMARFVTQRLAFRLAWIMPWGLVIGFFPARLRLRPLVTFLMLAAVTLGLARGDLRNYATLFREMYQQNRPTAEATAAFDFLHSLPRPQGVILASRITSRMIPAFLPEAYPVNFRELGPVDREGLKQLVERRHIDPAFMQELDRLGVGYILIEAGAPLDRAIRRGGGFELRYENTSYSVWERPAEETPG